MSKISFVRWSMLKEIDSRIVSTIGAFYSRYVGCQVSSMRVFECSSQVDCTFFSAWFIRIRNWISLVNRSSVNVWLSEVSAEGWAVSLRIIVILLHAGVHNYASRHLDRAVEFLAKTIGKYPYEEVMGPTYDLSDLPEAMRVAVNKQYSRILIKPDMAKTTND